MEPMADLSFQDWNDDFAGSLMDTTEDDTVGLLSFLGFITCVGVFSCQKICYSVMSRRDYLFYIRKTWGT